MNSILRFLRPLLVAQLVLTGFTGAAQNISIPDPGLNAVIRETLQKPNGELTQQNLSSLTDLNASGRSELTVLTNQIGTVRFEDVAAHLSPQKFYRARSF